MARLAKISDSDTVRTELKYENYVLSDKLDEKILDFL